MVSWVMQISALQIREAGSEGSCTEKLSNQVTSGLRKASGHGLPDIILVVWAVIVQRIQPYICLLHLG